MARLNDVFRRQTLSSDPITVGDTTITPQSQAITVRWPTGGWVWNRPVAVLIERDGETERIPIVDVSRIAQLGLLGLGVVFSVFALMRFMKERKRRNG